MAQEITSVNAGIAIAKLVAAQALPALFGNLVMGNLVNRDYEATLNQVGDTINIPLPPVMVANNLAEAGVVQNQNPNLGSAQIVLNSHIEATFNLPDVTRILASPDLIATYLNPAVIALAEKIETDLLNMYPLFTANTAVGAATAMDEARIDSAETQLFAAKVPGSQPRYLVMSGTAYSQARQISRFSEFQILGNPDASMAAIASGEVGKLKNFIVFRSQFAPKPSSTTYNLGFTRNAIGLAIRKLPMPLPGTGAIASYAEFGNFGLRVTMSYAPNSLAQQITVDCLYGAGVLRNNHAIQVQSN